jgi:manganese/zinc/iron transport system permease protein
LSVAEREGLIEHPSAETVRLTPAGAESACRIVRNHRLWELYLIERADIDPSHVDRDADDIEHWLAPEVVSELERMVAQRYPALTVPPSPHTVSLAEPGSAEHTSE